MRELLRLRIGGRLPSAPEVRRVGMADGVVVSLWRYPLKSMQGEELNASHLSGRGLLGDRALALVDVETGKVVSAKNPRKWPAMFDFRGRSPRHRSRTGRSRRSR
jgi:uncharacterized protein YcbX